VCLKFVLTSNIKKCHVSSVSIQNSVLNEMLNMMFHFAAETANTLNPFYETHLFLFALACWLTLRVDTDEHCMVTEVEVGSSTPIRTIVT
jgi:hypothetical protein